MFIIWFVLAVVAILIGFRFIREGWRGQIESASPRRGLQTKRAQGVPEPNRSLPGPYRRQSEADSTSAPNQDSAKTASSNPPPEAEGEAHLEKDDDLTRIKGIGKVLEARLNGAGYRTLSQIADLSDSQATEVGELVGFPGRVERERWIEQAKDLLSKK